MKIFNLRDHDVIYRGKLIPANGGFVEMDLDFIPPRDLALQGKVLSFGELPPAWLRVLPQPAPAKVIPPRLPAPPTEDPPSEVSPELKRSRKAWRGNPLDAA